MERAKSRTENVEDQEVWNNDEEGKSSLFDDISDDVSKTRGMF